MAKVFISYSSKDWVFVQHLVVSMRRRDIDVWIDRRKVLAGDMISTEISKGLQAADVFCVVLSPDARKSRWVELELAAALHRRAQQPNFRIIPLLYRSTSIPTLLAGLHHLDFRNKNALARQTALLHSSITGTDLDSSTIPQARVSGISQTDWARALSLALRCVADDRFNEEDAEHKRGGWSKSYAKRFHKLAFEGNTPKNVSPKDSITVTHWVVRGLHSLNRLVANRDLLKPDEVLLIGTLLSDARNYLHNHFHKGKAGLWYVKSQLDLSHHPDVRHSATFAKALVQYGGESYDRIRSALSYVLKCANDPTEYDHRVPTHAEILGCIELLTWRPELRTRGISTSRLAGARGVHEEGLLAVLRPIICPPSTLRRPALFFDPGAVDHMAPFYTWWALDAYGIALLSSKHPKARRAARAAIEGLLSFEQRLDDSSSGFPLTSGGPCDVGATAQIAEVLYRLDPKRHADLAQRSLRYIVRALVEPVHDVYFPYTLWALFTLAERIYLDGPGKKRPTSNNG